MQNTFRVPQSVSMGVLGTDANYDEAAYLAANPDMAKAVQDGIVQNIREHFDLCGRQEGRMVLNPAVESMRAEKLKRLEPLLRADMPHNRRGLKWDFLSDDLRKLSGIVDTHNVSSFGYGQHAIDLIEEFPDGLILDCGAGWRGEYYKNVVNYEIVDYASTDVLGVGEALPFRDGSFDGLISVAVLEHVRDPFRCASEISRVLRPGGKLVCATPLLAPYHGYPHHYFNMTEQGARALFEGALVIDDHQVHQMTGPILALTTIIQLWASGLSGDARDEFSSLSIAELMKAPQELLSRRWVTELSTRKNFELCSGTILFAHKPSPGEPLRQYPALWGAMP